MGWTWTDDDDTNRGVYSSSRNFNSSSSNPNGDGERCATRKVVKSQCHTEEVEPGKFIRKCEKTEEIFKDCLGRPTEMVQSNKEYTEEDVTNQMVKGFPLESGEGKSYFPGLRSDVESIERGLFGGIGDFMEAVEEAKRQFFDSFGILDDSSSQHRRRGIHIESSPPNEAFTRNNEDGDVDLSGLARDV